MAVSVDIAAVVNSTASSASITVNLTIGATANFLAGKISGYTTVPNITNEQWNTSETLTSRITAVNAGTEDAAIYTLASPTTGAHALDFNFSPNTPYGAMCTAISFIGVGAAGSNTATLIGSQSSPISTAITVASGGMAIDVMTIDSSRPLTVGGSQVVDWAPTAWGGAWVGASTLLDATAMGWSWTGGDSVMSQAVLELTPSAGGITDSTYILTQVQPAQIWR